jgi:WD40 repeat protein
MTGQIVVGPFIGHTDIVMSVAFSPDGQCIISGSCDRTLCVWNATTGEMVVGPLTGHKDDVISVAFSPDGQHIISGSGDQTICLWSATTGERVGGPFIGHTHWVLSVAFSPDGHHFVSGSTDQTVHVWDVSTGGVMAAGLFTRHVDSAEPVAFSSDGQCTIPSELGSIHMLIDTTGNPVTTRSVDFTDHSIINEEGWICGSNGELLIWIPLIHRPQLHHPSNVWVSGKHETHMDLSKFVHGNSWSTCIDA